MKTNFLLLFLTIALVAGCASEPTQQQAPLAQQYRIPAEPPQPVLGSIFTSAGAELFADVRARAVGDILVVQLVEQTEAEKSSRTNIDKSSSVDVTNPVLAGKTRTLGRDNNLGFQLDSGHDFTGGSGSDQSNSLSGTVAVTVAAVLPGGNLLVHGEKWISINRGREFVRLSGIVRPTDISYDNVILSTRVANAEITYSGTGATANANAPGWLAKFFLGKVWPF